MFTVEIQECLVFLDLPHSLSGLWVSKELGFISSVLNSLLSRFFYFGLVEISLLSTPTFFGINVFSAGKEQARGPQDFWLIRVLLLLRGHYLF